MIEFLTMPKIFWFTGQADAGKKELANMLKLRLFREQTIVQHSYSSNGLTSFHTPNKKFVIIDDNDIREIYDTDSLFVRVEYVQKLCIFLKKNNIVPIVSMISPFAEQRRAFLEEENGIEIYVRSNQIRVTEKSKIDYYEPPIKTDNSIEIDTTNKSVEQSFNELWDNLFTN
jgi:adenylylsulfate kinase-like enzyme